MNKFLSHDAATGELRLVYTDLWNGQHERTEYRVSSHRQGDPPVRNRPDLDGRPVSGTAPALAIRDRYGAETPVWTEQVPVVPTVKVPCPKSSNARRKCSLCG